MTDYHVRNARNVLIRTFETPDLAYRFLEASAHVHGDLKVIEVRQSVTERLLAESHVNRDGSVQIQRPETPVRLRIVR